MTPYTVKQQLRDIVSNYEALKCKVCLIDDEIVVIEEDIDNLQDDLLDLEVIVDDHEDRITVLEGGSAVVNITPVENYSALPDPTTVPGDFYFVRNSQGTSWLPGSMGGTYYKAGLYYSDGVAWFVDVDPWEATQGDVDAGVVGNEFVTPVTLANATTVSHPGHTHVSADITDLNTTDNSIVFAIALG